MQSRSHHTQPWPRGRYRRVTRLERDLAPPRRCKTSRALSREAGKADDRAVASEQHAARLGRRDGPANATRVPERASETRAFPLVAYESLGTTDHDGSAFSFLPTACATPQRDEGQKNLTRQPPGEPRGMTNGKRREEQKSVARRFREELPLGSTGQRPIATEETKEWGTVAIASAAPTR